MGDESDADRSTAADRVPIEGTEIADGVKVGSAGNLFHVEWPDEEPDEEELEPASSLCVAVWCTLAVMLAVAIGALIWGY